ncbi:ABC transporter ATP-binding protein, partial [Salmonella enterica subsp. enterica serovar Typhimurium str. ST4581]
GRSELGVRLLSLRSVGDYVRRHEQLSGDALVEEMTLRDALSMFVARRCDVLPVANTAGRALRYAPFPRSAFGDVPP